MSATISIFLDTRRSKKNGKFPAKLLVVLDRIPKMYQTIYDLTQREFDSLTAPRVSIELQKVRENFKLIKREAEAVAEKLNPFSFEDFEKEYILNNSFFLQRKHLKKSFVEEDCLDAVYFDYTEYLKDFPILKEDFAIGTIGYTYVSTIKSLIRTQQIGSASNYQCSFKSLRTFLGNTTFSKIKPEVLKRYEQWMVEKGNSKSTVGIYMRGLRKMFNVADSEKIIRKEQCYPFGLKKYIIPEPRKRKKSLLLDDIAKIYYYQPDSELDEKARDCWMFLYLGNGMNAKDMCLLKYKDISEEFITFERSKTEKINRQGLPISVYITEEMRVIIDKWGNSEKNPDNFIFPVLKHGMTPLEIHHAKQNFTRFINDGMERIQKYLGMERRSNSNMARSSFATTLKRSGVPREFIKDAMGHKLAKTTDHYFDDFEDDIKKEFAENLLAFKR